MDLTIIERAGITQGQFASLAGVSRITVNTWVNGRFKPRAGTRERVARLVSMLTEALDAGTLPVQFEDRRKATESALESIRDRLNVWRG